MTIKLIKTNGTSFTEPRWIPAREYCAVTAHLTRGMTYPILKKDIPALRDVARIHGVTLEFAGYDD